jgi:hypothetical protein
MDFRIAAIFAAVTFAAVPGQAEGSAPYTEEPVTVFLDLKARVPFDTLISAENLAYIMFAKARVYLNWQLSRPKFHEMRRVIITEITSNTPSMFHPGALAYSLVFEGVHLRVFYDRLENAGGQRMTAALLAHVMVHEITHLLQGIDRHSEEGILKAHWTDKDVMQMRWRPLSFEPADIELIRKGLEGWGHHLQLQAANSSLNKRR